MTNRWWTKQRDNNALVVALTSLAVLIIARRLRPSPTGVGTHQQLGLPACPLLHLTGVPCPTCGFTTSFAYGVRGQFSQAILAQPAGFVIFCLTALSIPASIYLLYRRKSWAQALDTKAAKLSCYGLAVIIALGWLYKIVATK